MDQSYLEKCIAALPPEKQPAARAAFKDIAEGGDDSIFSKVLVTLEATSAYSTTIPQALTASGEKLLREFDARANTIARREAESDVEREEKLRQLIAEQVPQLARSLALDRVVAGLEAQTAELGRIERSVARLRRARVYGLLLLMLLGGIIGATAVGGVFWKRYQSAQRAERFVTRLNSAGITMEIRRNGQYEWLRVEGLPVLSGTTWTKNDRGEIIGAHFRFPSGGGQ